MSLTGPRAFPKGLQSVPTSITALSATTSIVRQITVVNTTNKAIGFTVQDGQSPIPLKLFAAQVINANNTQVFDFDIGLTMLGGVSWFASATGLNADIIGVFNC